MPLLTLRRLRYTLGRASQRVAPLLSNWDRFNFGTSVFAVGVVLYDIGFPKGMATEAFVADLLHSLAVFLLLSNALRLFTDLLFWRSLKGHLQELKGKFGAELQGVAGRAAPSDHAADILRALLALGYSEREATIVARKLPADATVSDGIKQALQLLART